MRPRPVRSQIYLPVLRFGLTDEDWGIVIAAGILGYAIPFFFGMKIGGVPLELVGWLIAAGLAIFALNLLRRKTRPAWLRHTLQARVRGGIRRRRLPTDRAVQWLKEGEEPQ